MSSAPRSLPLPVLVAKRQPRHVIRSIVAVASALVLLRAPTASAGFPPPVIDEVLFMGDSIAYDLAPAVETALVDAGVDVSTFVFPGISLTGSDWIPGDETWLERRIPQALFLSQADVVVWQLSRFDSPVSYEVNLLAHMAFADMALSGRTALVFVTAPPVEPLVTEAGQPQNWGDLTGVAYEVAERYPSRVSVLDSSPAWGDHYVEFADDGTPIRKPDGVHVCPFGALIFADFLVNWLGENFSGVHATDPSSWPLDFWYDDRYYNEPTVCRSR
jgi:hypothetical protein